MKKKNIIKKCMTTPTIDMFEMTITKYSDHSYIIKGEDTKQYKDVIKAMGALWNHSLKGWVVGQQLYTKLGGEVGILRYLLESEPATNTQVQKKPRTETFFEIVKENDVLPDQMYEFLKNPLWIAIEKAARRQGIKLTAEWIGC